MTEPRLLTSALLREIEEALAEARSQYATAQRMAEQYVRYIILANAGGIAACITLAGGLLKDKGSTIPLSHVAGPMWLFLVGTIAGGIVVSLQRAQAYYFAEQNALRAATLVRAAGQPVPETEPVFPGIQQRGLPYLERAIKFLGIVGQIVFAVGAIWGLVEIGRGG